MNENNEIKISVFPLIDSLLINTLNSLCKVIIILIQSIFIRDGINQNIGGIINSPINELIQFNDINILVDGSKEENKFAIIFNYNEFF